MTESANPHSEDPDRAAWQHGWNQCDENLVVPDNGPATPRWVWNGPVCAVWGEAIILGETQDEKEARARLFAAARDMASALAGLVEAFRTRPDILARCGPDEHGRIKAACDALNKAGINP